MALAQISQGAACPQVEHGAERWQRKVQCHSAGAFRHDEEGELPEGKGKEDLEVAVARRGCQEEES